MGPRALSSHQGHRRPTSRDVPPLDSAAGKHGWASLSGELELPSPGLQYDSTLVYTDWVCTESSRSCRNYEQLITRWFHVRNRITGGGTTVKRQKCSAIGNFMCFSMTLISPRPTTTVLTGCPYLLDKVRPVLIICKAHSCPVDPLNALS